MKKTTELSMIRPASGTRELLRRRLRSTRLSQATKLRIIRVSSVATLLLVWSGLTGFEGLIKPITPTVFLPSPFAVAATFIDLAQTGYQGTSLAEHFAISAFRFCVAMLFCILVAIPVGLVMGMSSTVHAILDPQIEILRPVPKLAIIPLLIIWFGIGELPKVIVIIMTVFPILSISAMQSVKLVSLRKIQAAYSLGATKRIVFFRVILPASLPGIFTGIRVSLAIAVVMLVAAEMIATSSGIAWMTLSASDFLQSNVILVGVIILSVAGYLLDQLARWIEARVVHWSGKEG